jgi:hypothetical protein
MHKLFNFKTSEAGLLNKSSCLAPALGVAKVTIVIAMILATLCCAALSRTKMFHNPTPTLGLTKFIIASNMILVTLCCATSVKLGCSINPRFVEQLSWN